MALNLEYNIIERWCLFELRFHHTMCDGNVISREHHTLVDLNEKRIITSEHEFAIQHILMIILYHITFCGIKLVNYVLLLLTVSTHF